MEYYSQPKFYHFSEDSIVLAKKGYEVFKKKIRGGRKDLVLVDAFSGCGVVGLEVFTSFKKP